MMQTNGNHTPALRAIWRAAENAWLNARLEVGRVVR
jgi:hypothetical protein